MPKFAFLAAVAFAAAVPSLHAAQREAAIRLGAEPCVSPDGLTFYFEWADSIWRAPVAGGAAVRITGSSARETTPLVSPDGKSLAFLSDRDGAYKVHVMDLASGETRQISWNTEFTRLSAWSPDGTFIVGGAERDHAATWRARRIAFFGLDGRERFPLEGVVAYDGALSPDGSLLAFSRRGGDPYRKRRSGKSPVDSEIWLYNLADKTFTPAATPADAASFPRWRPDGKAFYYLGRMPGSPVAEIREHSLSGEDRKIASFGADAAFEPSVSADGRVIVARAGSSFWRLDPADAAPVPVRIDVTLDCEKNGAEVSRRRTFDRIDAPGRGVKTVSFCSGGNEFAFVAGGALYAMDPSGGEPRLVAEEKAGAVRECAFSPDGERLYHLVDFGDRSEIRVAFKTDSAAKWRDNAYFAVSNVVSAGKSLRCFSVSPCGKRMAWFDALGKTTFAAMDGAVVAEGPEVCGSGAYAWSPDGKHIAAVYLDGDNNEDVWIVSTDGSHEPYNLSRSWRWDGDPAWSPDGKIIAWSSTRRDGRGEEISYVYLNPADEAADAAAARKGEEIPAGDSAAEIVFDGLYRRVRRTGIPGYEPFFSHDSRTLAYDTGTRTDIIRIPDVLKGEKLASGRGVSATWYKEEDVVAWVCDGRPAHLDEKFEFSVCREYDMRDYRALAFRTAWGRLRDRFYDRSMRGLDWRGVLDRYLPLASEAPAASVFARALKLMTGELDASHTGFWQTEANMADWPECAAAHSWNAVSGHLGVFFEPGSFKIRKVLKGSPAEGVLFPGDTIEAIDGEPVSGGRPLDAMLLKPPEARAVVSVAGRPPVEMELADYTSIRSLVEADEIESARRAVDAATGGRVGYLAVRQMQERDYVDFENEIYAECRDKDALVIDMRGNTGGLVADRMLAVLCSPDHARFVSPNGVQGYIFGYWTHPVFAKPVAVVVDEAVQSNGEIFVHAIKNLKRGLVVGRRTSGEVIATFDRPLLDYGVLRDPFWGCFLPDGTDMECCGVEPDIEVVSTPADEERRQESAVSAAAAALLERLPEKPKQFVPRYASPDRGKNGGTQKK